MARTKEAQRRAAAENVCWSLMLMISLGALDDVPMEWRPFLAKEMEAWAELAVQTGQLRSD